jgi:hypothetical protein
MQISNLRFQISNPLSVLCCATFALPLLCTTLAAQEADPLRVASLVRKLGADSFTERQQADLELAGLGAAARSELEAALASPDAEIRQRAKGLLTRLKTADLWEPTIYQGRTAAAAASQVLMEIQQQTGNRLLFGESYGNFSDRAVALRNPAASFWETVDDLCRQSGNAIRPHYDLSNPALVISGGATGRHPLAYAGPVRGQVTSARRVFIEELDYQDLESETTHTFQLNLLMLWEGRLRLVAYRAQPELLEAITDTGVNLAATQSGSGSWSVVGPGTRQVTMNLRLDPSPVAAQELSRLRLSWGLIAVGDMATLALDGVRASPQRHFQDDVELTVESIEEQTSNRHVVTLLIARDLVMPEPQDIVFNENLVELSDAAGAAFTIQGQSNSLTSEGARMKITFAGEPGHGAPHALRFHYPRLRSQRDVEIEFQNVPLPVGRPQ